MKAGLLLIFIALLISTASAITSKDYIEIFFDDDTITKDELLNVLSAYMLNEDYQGKNLKLEWLRDASYIYVYWDGKPKRIIDSASSELVIYKPVKNIVVLNSDSGLAVQILGSKDKVVGVSTSVKSSYKMLPEISQKPSVGLWNDPNIEEIVKMAPDLVLSYVRWPTSDKLEDKLAGTGITVVRLDFYILDTMKEEMKKLGYILDAEKYAEEYIKWFEYYVNLVTSRIPEEDKKVKVYTTGGTKAPLRAFAEGTGLFTLSVLAGGKNVLEGRNGYFDVTVEALLDWKPEVILLWSSAGGYEVDDDTELIKDYNGVLNTLQSYSEEIPAIKNERIYVLSSKIGTSPSAPASLVAVAKALYPENYGDLDPVAIHQEFIDKFLGINFDVKTQGAFFYSKSFGW
ncbi:MAG: ABC transporter substrate-binding protein [Archaeoglobaceae archaeon]